MQLITTLLLLISLANTQALSVGSNNLKQFTTGVDRRGLLISTIAGITTLTKSPLIANSVDENAVKAYAFESRDRNKNKDALIRDDIWYFTNQNPPRKLDLTNLPPGPKYNAWGSCATDGSTGNSCTYVSLKQRIPAYSQYSFSISLGAKEFIALGKELRTIQSKDSITNEQLGSLLEYIEIGKDKKYLPPAPDALLKMILLSTALLTSPNYTGPPFELLIARYYTNEVSFSMKEIANALRDNDLQRALAAWDFGADSWNSYYTIVNNAIVPKVGDKFEMMG